MSFAGLERGPAPQAEALVGRGRERDAIDSLLAGAREAGGGSLFLHGEAGVGKSVLLDYACARAPDFELHSATGVEPESELPYCGVADLIDNLEDPATVLSHAQTAALRSALGLEHATQVDRFAVYTAIRTLLAEAARERPQLVLVDDLQWLDSASRDAVVFAAKRLTDDRVAILFAARDGEGADLAELGFPELHLRGLPVEESDDLLARHAPHSSSSVRRALHAGTAGNPLALVELARDLDDDQLGGRRALPEPLPMGRRLEQVFGARVRRLPGDTQMALLIAAASESGSMDIVLAAVTRLGLPSDGLGPAEDAGLIRIEQGQLTWRHPLVRSASYHAAANAERRAAHLALADVAGESRLDDHRAWHLAAAADAPHEVVAAALEGVAARASARGALATAMRALTAAARLSPADDERARRLVGAAEIAVALGESDDGVRLAEEALPRTGDTRLRAKAERVRARVDMLRGVPAVAHDRLVATAESIADDDPALAVEILAEAIVANMADGNSEEYRRTAERAIALAPRAGAGAEAVPSLLLSLDMIACGRANDAIELFDRYSGIVEQPELWTTAPEIVGITALGLVWLERTDEAARLLARVIGASRDAAALRALTFPLAVEADLRMRLGQLAAARAVALESVQIAEDVGEVALLANNLAYLGRIEAWLGSEEDSRTHATRSLELSEALSLKACAPYARHALGLLDLALGEHDRAIAHLEPARNEYPGSWGEPNHVLWEGGLAEAYIRAGRDGDAAEAVERYAGMVRDTGRPHGRAVLARLRGLRTRERDIDRHFREAIEWHGRAREPHERARTQLYYGERLRRARRRADARVELAAAATTFESLGAKRWLDRTRHEQVAAGERVELDGPTRSWGDLTAAESRVAQAILSGATYRQAADSLYLSPRTVEFHLRQVYRKLGVRSRGELAALLSSTS